MLGLTSLHAQMFEYSRRYFLRAGGVHESQPFEDFTTRSALFDLSSDERTLTA